MVWSKLVSLLSVGRFFLCYIPYSDHWFICQIGVKDRRLLCLDSNTGRVQAAHKCDHVTKPSDTTSMCNLDPCPPE